MLMKKSDKQQKNYWQKHISYILTHIVSFIISFFKNIIKHNPSENYDLLSLLSILKDLTFLMAIYLYFMGWIYAYYFFQHFGISLVSVDIPFYYFFVYSYTVISNISNNAVFIAVGATIIYLFSTMYLKKWNVIWILAVVLIILLSFPAFFDLAKDTGEKKALELRRGNVNEIVFFFKKDTAKLYPQEFISANNKGELKLITQTKDLIYVFYQTPGEALSHGLTYDISRTDILVAKIKFY
jgi:hypothetical protein